MINGEPIENKILLSEAQQSADLNITFFLMEYLKSCGILTAWPTSSFVHRTIFLTG